MMMEIVIVSMIIVICVVIMSSDVTKVITPEHEKFHIMPAKLEWIDFQGEKVLRYAKK